MADNRSKFREGSSNMVNNLGNLALSYQQLLDRGRGSSEGRDSKDGLVLFLDE